MIKIIKKIIVGLVPFQIRRKLFHPLVVHNDYSCEIALTESVLLMKHNKENLDDEFWASNLRKAAHILDKGLQRFDCEPGHSVSFYQKARNCLDNIKGDDMINDPSILWAIEKLSEYDQLQKSGNIIQNEQPFKTTICNYDHLIDLIKTRRSIRSFTDQLISPEVIKKITDVVNWAPSSCNRQTTKIFIADSKELIKVCTEANNGATCFTGEISCYMSFCADLRPYDLPTEMMLPVLDVSLGMQNCCLAAHSLGVGVAILNWTHHSPEQDSLLRKALSIPPYYRIVANAVLGYPEKGAPLPARKGDSFTSVFR
ncbi:MAG: nitroreductase family protein [Pedobacter sp.]